MEDDAGEGRKAIADLTLITFYFLLRVGEYRCKQRRNDETQTLQFREQDVTFSKQDKKGRLTQANRKTTAEEITKADSCNLKILQQKNGWRGVCINHHSNDDLIMCPVIAIGCHCGHIAVNKYKPETFLSTYWVDGNKYDVTDAGIRSALKHTRGVLNYPELKGIPINPIDTYQL